MKIDVLEDAQRWIEIAAEALRHVGDARTLGGAMRLVRHIAVEDGYMSLLNDPNTGDRRQQG
jgi:hypothetical protein